MIVDRQIDRYPYNMIVDRWIERYPYHNTSIQASLYPWSSTHSPTWTMYLLLPMFPANTVLEVVLKPDSSSSLISSSVRRMREESDLDRMRKEWSSSPVSRLRRSSTFPTSVHMSSTSGRSKVVNTWGWGRLRKWIANTDYTDLPTLTGLRKSTKVWTSLNKDLRKMGSKYRLCWANTDRPSETHKGLEMVKQGLTWGLIERCRMDSAPFLPCPEVVTNSTHGSTELSYSSLRKAGSPMATSPHGPMLSKLSITWKDGSFECVLDKYYNKFWDNQQWERWC